MVNAWRDEFLHYSNVDIFEKSIFNITADAIVSPANSFGIMDGGLDGKLRDYFGKDIEEKVRSRIRDEYHGELPVGNAITIRTNHNKFKFLISAPTMRVPENIATTQNAYLAMRAILIECLNNNFNSVAIPGLGALSGQMSYNVVARQMRVAYDKIINRSIIYTHWREEKELQIYMKCEMNHLPYDYEK